jgi:hypothetical protein
MSDEKYTCPHCKKQFGPEGFYWAADECGDPTVECVECTHCGATTNPYNECENVGEHGEACEHLSVCDNIETCDCDEGSCPNHTLIHAYSYDEFCK